MLSIQLISDFNIQILGRYLANSSRFVDTPVNVAPFGQVFQSLMKPLSDNDKQAGVIVWTRPESVLETYNHALYFQQSDHNNVLAELDDYITALRAKTLQVKYLFHPVWTLPYEHRGYGLLDFKQNLGIANLLARLNLRLSEELSDLPNFFMLDAERWLRKAGPRFSAPKLWYASKIPFTNTVFQSAAEDIVTALNGLNGKSRKLIIVDLDNTLWGGVIGETGWRGIKLGGHDFVGEAFVEFQRKLKALSDRGVQLAIVSKNDEPVALEAIDQHPDMQLRRHHFAGWRINWSDKAQNIVDLVQELNLGLDASVFIDDNPVERARVQEALGDKVLVPDWPADPAEYNAALSSLSCFDTPAISAEDRARAQMYAAERERRAFSTGAGSFDEWLATLEMVVTVENVSADNIVRVIQLLNKTNQMNLRTRRFTEEQLKDWLAGGDRKMWAFRVSDRFGDSGLTGVISLDTIGDTAYISDFVMSCRVMGRKVEEIMIHTAVEYILARQGVSRVKAEFIPTERNRPCLDFWKSSKFAEQSEYQFCLSDLQSYPIPSYIQLNHC